MVGLGNPGVEYEKTPHNAGFLCIDELCQRLETNLNQMTGSIGYRRLKLKTKEIVLAKPLTYMNESGRGVRFLMEKLGITPQQLFIIYDDIDLKLGEIRIRERGSAGSHRGMRSVIGHLNTQLFPRLRIGIRAENEVSRDVISYVLTPFRGKKNKLLKTGIVRAADAVMEILNGDIHQVMNRYNRRTNSLLLATEAEQTIRRKNGWKV